MIFINNKYKIWYFNIITKAKQRQIFEGYEVHHIIPRSLGGNDEPENLVKLTFKEHLTVHHLLTKITQKKDQIKMMRAYNMLSNFKKYNGKKYALLRQQFIDLYKGENHPNYGKKQKQSTIEKRLKNTDPNSLKSQLGKKGPLHPTYRKSPTEEHRQKISKTSKGHKKPNGFQVGENNSNYGKRYPGSRTGCKNLMYGLLGESNPNYGSKRTTEQKYNIKISRIIKNIDVYISIVNRLKANETVEQIHVDTGISYYVINQIKNGTHAIHEFLKKNDSEIKK